MLDYYRVARNPRNANGARDQDQGGRRFKHTNRQIDLTDITNNQNPSSLLIRAATAIVAVPLTAIIVSRLVYPFDNGHLEALSWVPATHILEGVNPYSFALVPPYSMAPYGIVYYAMLSAGVSLFGLQLWFGRILTVLALAICVWAVGRITRRITGSSEAAWVACLLSIALFPVQGWIAIMRPDIIGLAFALAAVCLVFTTENEEFSVLRLSTILLLSVGAVFTKHTMLLPVVIVVLRFLQLDKRREATLFSAAFVIVTAAGVFTLNYTSGGGYVWQHFIHAETLPFVWEGWLSVVVPVALQPTTIVLAVALILFAYHAKRFRQFISEIKSLRSPTVLILFYCFFTLSAAVLSAARVGANVNYFLEASFVVAVVGGLIYEGFRATGMRRAAVGIIMLIAAAAVIQLARVARGEYFRWQSRSYYQEISETAAKVIPPGSACVSVYPELVARSGCEIHFDDYGEYIGGWSEPLTTAFENEMRRGRYAVIIWGKDDLEEQFPAYELVPMSQSPPDRFFPVYLYRAKSN